jgi:hypothetical protein
MWGLYSGCAFAVVVAERIGLVAAVLRYQPSSTFVDLYDTNAFFLHVTEVPGHALTEFYEALVLLSRRLSQ